MADDADAEGAGQCWRSKLIDLFGYAGASGRSSRKIMASHRTTRQHPDIG